MKSSAILDRLKGIRRVARRRLIFFGVFAVLAGGIAAFFTILLVDWLVWLPPALRIVAGTLFLAGFLGATVHWIVAPLRAQLTLQELAGKIEKHFPPLDDRLASSVNFLQRGDIESSAMALHVVEATERAIEKLPLEEALVGGPVTRRALAFGTMVVLLAGTLIWSPHWLHVGSNRYLHPLRDIEWPRSVSIVPLTADQVVALGDSMTVSMRVERGWREGMRAVVHFHEPDGVTNSIAMQGDGGARYTTSISSITSDLSYWFECGDATTEKQPAHVRVVRRPEVVEATAVVEAPPYAANLPTRAIDLRDGPAMAPIGGKVTLHLRSSKEVVIGGGYDAAGLHTDDGQIIPLQPSPDDPKKLIAQWTVDRDLEFRARLRDEHGFENRGATTFLLHAVPDAPPSVTVLEPPSVSEATATARIPVVVRAEDDFGIDELQLSFTRPGTAPTLAPIESLSRSVTSDAGVQVMGTTQWDLSLAGAAPGEVISYRVVARDNYRSEEFEGQLSASADMRIKILSDHEFELRIREDLTALEERLRRTTFDQAALYDDTASLQLNVQNADELTDAQKEAAASLSVAQLRIARQVRDTAMRFDEIGRRVERNTPRSDERDRIRLLGESLRSVAAGPMAGASALLSRAREPNDVRFSEAALAEAGQSQQTALNGMRDVLRSMGQWGAFQGVVARTQDLLDRQAQIRHDTGELGRSTLGKPVESMDVEEIAVLRKNQRRQEQLLEDVKEHLSRLEQMRVSLAQKDPVAAEAVDSAIRSARADDLIRHMREAASAMAVNRTGAAETEQRASAAALQRMLSSLHEKEERELAQLRKRLDEAVRQVDELIEEQKTVLSETVGSETHTESELEALGGLQRTLARNARFLGDELIEEHSTEDAGRKVRQAATPMLEAENDLASGSAVDAVPDQESALSMLNEARDSIRATQELAAEEQLRRSLEEIHQELQAILTAQKAINGAMSGLRGAIDTAGRLGRAETREAARLSKDQLEARVLVSGLLPDMEQVAVYRWALERVGRWMDGIHESLDARKLEDETLVSGDRIVHDLENLIAALIQTQTMPLDTEFTEAGEGGGQADADASAPKLPTMAELLVLKTMQADINARTMALYAKFDAGNPSEQSLREISVLGEDQAQVRQLTQMVTDRSRRR